MKIIWHLRYIEVNIRGYNMSQEDVLDVLRKFKKPMRSSEIAKHININPNTVSTNCRKLYLRGAIKRGDRIKVESEGRNAYAYEYSLNGEDYENRKC